MRVQFDIKHSDVERFKSTCEATIINVGKGTKEASVLAVSEIISDALGQVPVDTGTLAASIYGGTFIRGDIKSASYGGIVGFGAPAAEGGIDWIIAPNDGINPKSGLRASDYATAVHEDLTMPHRRGGKAKFLEDPVRSYNDGKLMTLLAGFWRRAISGW